MIDVKFWGVRGSCPAPLTPNQVERKVREAFEAGQLTHMRFDDLTFESRSTYGGNTTCVEVNCGSETFILDLGTGVRELGKSQLSALFKGGTDAYINATILQSHLHHDHIQGLPFYAPLYLDNRKFSVNLDFFGGKEWDSQLEAVYHGQMESPLFPVNLKELRITGANMSFQTIYDGWIHQFYDNSYKEVNVSARKLNHPQETFGYRIEYKGKKIAFTTDHEPYGNGESVPYGLAELVQGVDLWITDCQYTHDQYIGKTGIQRYGWGHSHEKYIAAVAAATGVKRVITTHHDPDADDFQVKNLSLAVQQLCNIETEAAYEGMTISV